MKMLLVEDDQNKARRVSEFLHSKLPSLDITEARSYQSGLKLLIGSSFAFAIVDMSIPTFDRSPSEPGGRPRSFGGREILAQMLRRRIATPVIVLTQFDAFGEGDGQVTLAELAAELKELYGGILLGTVYYDSARSNWKGQLMNCVQHISGNSKGRTSND